MKSKSNFKFQYGSRSKTETNCNPPSKSNARSKFKSNSSSTYGSNSKFRSKQTSLLSKPRLEYGGTLLKTRAARAYARPIDTKKTMHLVLRSSKVFFNFMSGERG